MTSLVRKAFLVVPALALAAVLLIHPTDQADTIYESVQPVVDDWITVHIALLFGFAVLALATAMLVRGLEGRAATVARVSLVFFTVFYTAWEVMAGLTTGLLTKYANGLPAAEQAGTAKAIQDLNEHWITQMTLTLGSLGWIVAVVAVAVAVRGIGAGWPAVGLLGLSATFVIHPPPVGPVALLCFVAGALLAERARSRRPAASTMKLRGAPATSTLQAS